MRLKFFSIPAFDLEVAETELNRFLASHRIHKIDRHFIQDGSASCWCLCVLYQEKTDHQANPEKRERIDYKELLSEDDFALFVQLRDLRKHLAQEEGVPVYTIFNNAQLAEMVQQRMQTLAQLHKIDGVGEARISKYGQAFLDQLHQAMLEQNAGREHAP